MVRPGVIVGPRNPNDSLRYWIVNCLRGGEVLAPGTGQDPVQYTDVDDLAAFCIHALEQRRYGTFNTLGPRTRLTQAEFLHGLKAVTPGDATFTWVSEEFLRQERVPSMSALPMWAPLSEDPGFFQLDAGRAFAAGYEHRPLADTARASLRWFREAFPEDYEFGGQDLDGMTSERERALLEAWHRR